MKLTAWQMVAALAVMFAAIIVASIFAPGTLAVIVSLVTTAFAALGLSGLRRPETPASEESGARVIPIRRDDE